MLSAAHAASFDAADGAKLFAAHCAVCRARRRRLERTALLATQAGAYRLTFDRSLRRPVTSSAASISSALAVARATKLVTP